MAKLAPSRDNSQNKTPGDSDRSEPCLPGALGPFNTAKDRSLSPEEGFEAEEVSLTSLTRSLLSRLQGTVRNTSVALIDDDGAKMTFHVPDSSLLTDVSRG
jgi:hypothetical protein